MDRLAQRDLAADMAIDLASGATSSLRHRRPEEPLPGSGEQAKLPTQPETHQKPWSSCWTWLAALSNKIVPGIPSGRNSAAWHSFQQQRLRTSVDSEQTLIQFLLVFMSAAVVCKCVYEPEDMFMHSLFIGLLVVVGILLALCHFRLKACDRGSREEWHICIAHQAIFIAACYAITLVSTASVDKVVTHRMFLMRYLFALGLMVHWVYLPQPYHSVFVTFPGVCVWIFFHWSVGFFRASAVVWGFGYPALELLGFHFSERREWSLCRVLEDERRARSLGESLKEAMRGMLNVVFDASCECDESGNVISSSRHLQSLVGMSSNEMIGLDLIRLAANPSEQQRILEFLSLGAAVENKEGIVQEVQPPSLMETTLFRRAEFDTSTTDLRVKLCCVALPTAEPDSSDMEHASDKAPMRRLFVGLQEVAFSSERPDCPDSSSDRPRVTFEVQQGNSEEPSSNSDGQRRTQAAQGSRSNSDDQVSPSENNPAKGPRKSQRKGTNSLLTTSRLQAAGALEDSVSELPIREDDNRSLASLSISWTGTNVTAERSKDFAKVIANTSTQTQDTPVQSVGCQTAPISTTSASGVPPPLPGPPPEPASQAAVAKASNRHPRQPLYRQKRATRTPFLPYFIGTPQHTIEFLLQEHVLMRINPCAKGCCFWHASLTLLATLIHEMRLRKCARAMPPESNWQCPGCKCLNEEDADSGEDAGECIICGDQIDLAPDLMDHHADGVEVGSNFADESKSAGSDPPELPETDDD